MGITFKRRVQKTKILNPADNFKEMILTVETRWDPLTKRTARVLDLPITKFPPWPLEEMLEKGGKRFAPFALKPWRRSPPDSPKILFKGGSCDRGRFAYSRTGSLLTGIVPWSFSLNSITCPLNDFTEDILFSAFSAACLFLRRVVEADPAVRFFSINWNYLPMSGGSIIHPHLQILAGEFPTHYQGAMIQGCRRYQKRFGKNYWEDLIDTEKSLGQRYISALGRTTWLASYAPLGVTDIMSLFKEQDLAHRSFGPGY